MLQAASVQAQLQAVQAQLEAVKRRQALQEAQDERCVRLSGLPPHASNVAVAAHFAQCALQQPVVFGFHGRGSPVSCRTKTGLLLQPAAAPQQ